MISTTSLLCLAAACIAAVGGARAASQPAGVQLAVLALNTLIFASSTFLQMNASSMHCSWYNGNKRICKGHFLVPADCECKYLAQIPTTRVDLSARDERSWVSFTKTLANEVQAADQGKVVSLSQSPSGSHLTPFKVPIYAWWYLSCTSQEGHSAAQCYPSGNVMLALLICYPDLLCCIMCRHGMWFSMAIASLKSEDPFTLLRQQLVSSEYVQCINASRACPHKVFMVADNSSGALNASAKGADVAMLCVTSPGWCTVAEASTVSPDQSLWCVSSGCVHDMAVWLQLSWHFNWLTNSTS